MQPGKVSGPLGTWPGDLLTELFFFFFVNLLQYYLNLILEELLNFNDTNGHYTIKKQNKICSS